MRITTWARGALVAAGLGLALQSTAANAAIFGTLEAPDEFASGISNVQGWAYTDTPGAELVQPFDVLLDGEVQFQVPCCGDRGDVMAANPGAPLQTGFSAVYNWGLAWVARNTAVPVSAGDSPQGGGGGGTSVVVQVRVTDTMGGEKLLTKVVSLYHPTTWPRSKLAEWKDSLDPDVMVGASADLGQGVLSPAIESDCTLRNSALFGTGAASLECEDMKFTAPDDTTFICPTVFFDWDRTTQSFKLASNCLTAIPK